MIKEIELVIEEKTPDGYVKTTGGRPLKDIVEELNQRLWTDLGIETDEGFGYCWWNPTYGKDGTWPTKWSWIVCHAVTGNNEGHYAHVAIAVPHESGNRTYELLFFAKTFLGMDHAEKLAQAAGRLLGA